MLMRDCLLLARHGTATAIDRCGKATAIDRHGTATAIDRCGKATVINSESRVSKQLPELLITSAVP
jgi:hypothetical protein